MREIHGEMMTVKMFVVVEALCTAAANIEAVFHAIVLLFINEVRLAPIPVVDFYCLCSYITDPYSLPSSPQVHIPYPSSLSASSNSRQISRHGVIPSQSSPSNLHSEIKTGFTNFNILRGNTLHTKYNDSHSDVLIRNVV